MSDTKNQSKKDNKGFKERFISIMKIIGSIFGTITIGIVKFAMSFGESVAKGFDENGNNKKNKRRY